MSNADDFATDGDLAGDRSRSMLPTPKNAGEGDRDDHGKFWSEVYEHPMRDQVAVRAWSAGVTNFCGLCSGSIPVRVPQFAVLQAAEMAHVFGPFDTPAGGVEF